MKKFGRFFAALLLSCVGLPQLVHAVSWSPIHEELGEETAQGIMTKGAVVCLFESGTADVKKAITGGDTLVVYREKESHELRAVGKIKVVSYSGSDYLKGEVIEGEIKAGRAVLVETDYKPDQFTDMEREDLLAYLTSKGVNFPKNIPGARLLQLCRETAAK